MELENVKLVTPESSLYWSMYVSNFSKSIVDAIVIICNILSLLFDSTGLVSVPQIDYRQVRKFRIELTLRNKDVCVLFHFIRCFITVSTQGVKETGSSCH